MRFLVLGSNGMVGHTVSLYLKKQHHEVVGFGRRPFQYTDYIIGDAEDTTLIEKIITEGKYNTIINCIGILNQSAEQQQADAVFSNSYLPHYLAEITKDMKTQIINGSTDCVFSGKRGGYTTTDLPDADSFLRSVKKLLENLLTIKMSLFARLLSAQI